MLTLWIQQIMWFYCILGRSYNFNFKTKFVFDRGRERPNQSQKAQKTCIIKIEPNWANWSTFLIFVS